MRSFAKFIVLICLLAVVSSCSDDNRPWAKYTSAEGGFTVMMPSRVKKSEKKEMKADKKEKKVEKKEFKGKEKKEAKKTEKAEKKEVKKNMKEAEHK